MAKTIKKSYPAAPRKVAPSHPGAGIGIIIKDVGLSIREAAEMMAVSHNALANLIRGASGITPEMAVRLGAFMLNGEDLQSGAAFWLRLQADYDLWHAIRALEKDTSNIKPCPREPKEAA